MTRAELFANIKEKQSFLCVGLDTDIAKIPQQFQKYSDPVFEFNKQIIEATQQYAVAYKPNVAFYEAMGAKGWESLQKTLSIVPEGIFTIADAKRGDVGHSSEMYARAFFEHLNVDALTVAPYMGEDSIKPYLKYKNKWIILLVHTSNAGSEDIQLLETQVGKFVFEHVILASQRWATPDQMMYVVGATRADKMDTIRRLAPEHFFLVPGIGAQGGDLGEVSQMGMNMQCGLLVNASRSILYASSGEDFAEKAQQECSRLQKLMAGYLAAYATSI